MQHCDEPVKREVMDVFSTEENKHNPAFNPRGQFHKFAHTHWGTQSLVHLPGVRNFVAEDETTLRDEQLKMAKLAYFGPGNLEDAWVYFNAFVKGDPQENLVNEYTLQDPMDPSKPYYPAQENREWNNSTIEMTL